MVILSATQTRLGTVQLDWDPQPGSYLELNAQTYRILERHHRYHFLHGRYHLSQVVLWVQVAVHPSDRSLYQGCWVIGDATCHFNARSELLRCALHPDGPCQGCSDYQPVVDP
jgi:hypothetical protein